MPRSVKSNVDKGLSVSAKQVTTVLGPVDADTLGVTLTHEHLLYDHIVYLRGPEDVEAGKDVGEFVRMDQLGALRRRAAMIADNGRNYDPYLAAREVDRFKEAGGGTVVDVSSRGLGRDAAGLKNVAELTGVNIVTCCGYYKAAGHPPDMSERTVDDLAAEFVREIEVGIDDTGVRAGVIGEIATGAPLYNIPPEVWDLREYEDMVPNEIKVLRASARAHNETGAPISVHIYNYRPNRMAHHALDIIESEGADLESVAICHLDTRPDVDYVASVADRGAFVEFDTFGMEQYSDGGFSQMPRDLERIQLVIDTIDRGYVDHILVSQDICWKMLLVEYGGWGFAHISKHIEPRLRHLGVMDEQIHKIRVANPARWLAH